MVVLDLLTGFRPIKSRMPIGTHFSAQNLFLTTNRNNWVNISKFSINRRLISSSNNKYSNDNAKNCTDNINVDNYKGGKYFGKGFPLPSGPDENELPKLEFGKPTGMYKMIRHSHGDPRGHLNSDGTIKHQYGSEEFHWQDNYTDVPKQNIVIVDGEKMIIGKDTRPMEKLYGLPQTNIPFTPRQRLNVWGNYNTILKAEFCFFWIPAFIIISLAVPCYTMLYMMDEAICTTMTVKVIGRQWYWIYEVESPAA
ncbi:cytochrome c oxidase subunit 2, putative [Babesia microti strain RI]|uniref:Cytochrome c oxidase subunit 2, putative n=1 Tax=Babesia microti (strain RI) TaxID=1133968 RepID=A0A1R4AB11_BABMR|nr:cytochrome c oxidase subunit 2, putative [Babesia microti strain RI]SJK86193.1 cytochrome c oxidase subunit 2, putative [Babesia microti strain RI]|eukprot:XP_021338382.1 cytochrome c oxidase subunit 2, putative [Babesia microti strain RI]